MSTAYFSCSLKTVGDTYDTVVHTFGSMEMLKDGFCIVVLVFCHWPLSVENLRDQDEMEWAAELRHMGYEFLVDRKPRWPAQAMELRKIANISTLIV